MTIDELYIHLIDSLEYLPSHWKPMYSAYNHLTFICNEKDNIAILIGPYEGKGMVFIDGERITRFTFFKRCKLLWLARRALKKRNI